MNTAPLAEALTHVFSELIDGPRPKGGVVLNTGDAGLLRSLDALSAADASTSANGGATIAAHAQHLRYGLSLMNRWAAEGGNPFDDATWDAAWNLSAVDDAQWREVREGLGIEAHGWLVALGAAREVDTVALTGLIGSLAHLAYHLGAIRQIARGARGPKEGTF